MFDPELYQTNRSGPDEASFKYLPKMISTLSWNYTKGNILDYGCGPGFLGHKYILPLAEFTDSQLFAVDISPKMVEYAENKFPSSRIQYKVGCFPDDFPFTDLKFDTIFSIHVFMYVKDIKGTLQGMMNVLKPGGQLAFSTCTINTPLFRVLREVGKSPFWNPYLGNVDEYLGLWCADVGSAGPEALFRKVFIEETDFQEVLFEYVDWLSEVDTKIIVALLESMSPQRCKIPKSLLGQLGEDYRRAYTTMVGVPYHAKSVPVQKVYVYAVLEKPK